jgi:hypothetical protein
MERAGKFLNKLANTATPEELAIAAWKTVIGKRLIRYAWAKALVRGNLIVETEDAIWQKQLFHLRHQILRRLAAVLGDEIVHDVEFRIATPRRPPQAAETASTEASCDEADRIEDPVMRLIYKRARKKASA